MEADPKIKFYSFRDKVPSLVILCGFFLPFPRMTRFIEGRRIVCDKKLL